MYRGIARLGYLLTVLSGALYLVREGRALWLQIGQVGVYLLVVSVVSYMLHGLCREYRKQISKQVSSRET